MSTDILHGGCNTIFCNYYSKEDKSTKLEYVVSLYRESDEVKVIKFLDIINKSWPKIFSIFPKMPKKVSYLFSYIVNLLLVRSFPYILSGTIVYAAFIIFTNIASCVKVIFQHLKSYSLQTLPLSSDSHNWQA
jgi:hypothetical protein